jgi:hypothetical protein
LNNIDKGLAILNSSGDCIVVEKSGKVSARLNIPFSYLGEEKVSQLINLGWQYYWDEQTWKIEGGK